MESVEGPRIAEREELPEIGELLGRCFNTEDYCEKWPQNYPPDGRYSAIIKVNGKIVSHVGCVPQILVCGDSEVACWGIGGVATDKPYRGKGYMSTLLKFWLKKMRDEGIPLSDLGGDRQRYSHFGWETAGRECVYLITNRSFSGGRQPIKGKLKEYNGDEDDLKLIASIHESERLRVERDLEKYKILFGRRGVRTVIYTDKNNSAYISFTTGGRTRSIFEFGGNPQGLELLIIYLMQNYDSDSINFHVHPLHPLNPFLKSISSRWHLQSSRMINIIDLPSTLKSFSNQIENRWKEANLKEGGEVVLQMIEDERTVKLSYSPETVTIEECYGKPDVLLDRKEMVQLLFGFRDLLHPLRERYRFLNTVLPLDFYIWKHDGV